MVDVVDHFNHTLERVMHGHMCDMISTWNQEPLKAAMEHATDNYIWVPLKHKLKSVQFPYKENARYISGLCGAINCAYI